MLASVYKETLQRFYSRVYIDQRPVRLGSVALISALTAYVHIFTWPVAVLFYAVYCACELTLHRWWIRVQPRLDNTTPASRRRIQAEMVAICAFTCWWCAIPCLISPSVSFEARVLGAVLSMGVLLVAAVEHSLHRDMMLWTIPPSAVALVWNLAALGQGQTAWMFGALGAVLVLNARTLNLSNTKAFGMLVEVRQAAEAANVAKSEFLATMSHEIRTPLNGVLGMAQILQRGDLAPAQRQQVGVIVDSGQALLSVLNGVLDLSKIEAGKIELEAAPFDLAETLRTAAAPYGPLAAQKGLAFSVHIDPRLQGRWNGDSARLTQVLANLMSNALKFTEAGGITLAVRPEPAPGRDDPCGGGLVFTVTDSGIGVPPEKAALIFEAFTQADASTSRRFGGTGLGLAISLRLVSLMGGRLTLSSREGEGATFGFTLRLTRANEALPSPPIERPANDLGDRPPRILAAEDNATNRQILQAFLEPLGVDLTLVEDGREAVEAFGAGDFDVILMDIQMPRLDGLAATAEIRRLEAATARRRIPIIALTANALRHQTDSYLASGFDDTVAKPIDFAALARALDRVLAADEDFIPSVAAGS